MKTIIWLLVIIVVLVGGFFALNSYIYNEKQGETTTMQEEEPIVNKTLPQVTPIMHATLLLQWDGTSIYTDPTDIKLLAGKPAPDIILITDIHSDHLSTSTLSAFVASSTILIVPQAVKDLLPAALAARAMVLKNDQMASADGFTITGIPMYNIPEATTTYHIKGRGNGYVIEKNNVHVYVAGDTSGTPEMRALQNIEIAFVPMNLPYTMGVDEAANAVLAFRPATVYPYHYRGQDGLSDVNRFKQLVNAGDPTINVIIANWYPMQ